MKWIKHLWVIVIFALLLCLISNCKKDSIAPPPAKLTAADSANLISLEINQFIWNGLNYYYLWVDSVPKLSPKYFQNDTNKWNTFLRPYSDHEKLFNDLLYKNTVDKWSWIVDDYTVLENELQGITKTMGFDFGLVRYGTGTNVFGFVRYVLPNSPASAAGLKRGDIFTKVDDQQITTSNYQTLLFNKDSYKLSFADIISNNITPNNRQANLTAIQLQENPVYLDTVYTINNNKIGYLVYNGFYPDFDVNLNDVFKTFKGANIQNLILDLRYNGGGSIQSAINLASMIYSTNHSKIFAKTKYNNQLQADILKYYGTSYFTDYFTDTIARQTPTGSPTSITSLGLSQLYVITTNNTASASELVINGLKPYVNVVTIGTNSIGKYVGSITVKDYDSKGNVNPYHKWAMQPIVLKISNANDVSDYVNGFTPKVVINEINYLASMLPLGDVNEPLLKAALNDLQGLQQQLSMVKSTLAIQKVADSKDFRPHSQEMFRDAKSLPVSHKTLFDK